MQETTACEHLRKSSKPSKEKSRSREKGAHRSKGTSAFEKEEQTFRNGESESNIGERVGNRSNGIRVLVSNKPIVGEQSRVVQTEERDGTNRSKGRTSFEKEEERSKPLERDWSMRPAGVTVRMLPEHREKSSKGLDGC